MSPHKRLIEVNAACEFASTFLADPILIMGAKAVLKNASTADAVFMDDIRVYLRTKLAEWNASENWASQPANVWGHTFIMECLDVLNSLEENNSSSEGTAEMIVTHTTDDYPATQASNSGRWYKKHYFCPKCNLEIGSETYEQDHIFASGSVLKNNLFPRFCPDCGIGLVKSKG